MITQKLAVTIGDVNGIGLECFVKALPFIDRSIQVVLCANVAVVEQALKQHALLGSVHGSALRVGSQEVLISHIDEYVHVSPGSLDTASGAHAVASLQRAVSITVSGDCSGIVTLPLSKDVCARSGFAFPGQTEYFEHVSNTQGIMVLCSGTVRVALATIHVPLRSVVESLSTGRIESIVRIFHHHLKTDRGVGLPRIAVLAVNPHAGEHGRIGCEEDTLIRPALERLSIEGYAVDGPYAADGFFAFGDYRRYDGIVAMYHDQGLIPLKLLAEGGGVNCTAGLPLVRTSPDHGTAFSLAGKGRADSRSTVEAIHLAAEIVRMRAGKG